MKSTTTDTVTHKARIAKKLIVEFSYQAGQVEVVWEPAMPSKMTRQIHKRYRAARSNFMQMIAHHHHGTVMTIDLDGAVTVSTPPEVH